MDDNQDQIVRACSYSCQEVRVVSRDQWGAAPPLDFSPMPGGRVHHVLYVHYTHSAPCNDVESCSAQMRRLQERHLRNGGDDIYYNFMLGGDGRVYEGRGWFSQPEKFRRITKLDPASIYIGYIGDLSESPNMYQWDAAWGILEIGFRNNFISRDHFMLYYCS